MALPSSGRHADGVDLSSAVLSGAGASGLLHALALRAAGVRIAAIFDPDAARARALAEAVGAEAVPSFDDLRTRGADIACICSPPGVHVAQARRLEGAVSVVTVEKPVATTPGELAALLAMPRCVPIVQWRAGRALRALRTAISHGELGARPVVSCDLAWARDDDYFRARTTWGCGALLSIGIHALDAVTWALGRAIESVSGMTFAREPAAGETSAVAVVRYVGGALLSLRLSLDGGADATRITACGGGVTASIAGTEADPTGTPIAWLTRDAGARRRLEALERASDGTLGTPLLVPYLAGVLDGLRAGESPGDSDRLPSIATTLDAHEAAMLVAAPPASARPAAPPHPASASRLA